MNQNSTEIHNFAKFFSDKQFDCETWIAPQSIHIPLAQSIMPKNFFIGSQNCSHKEKGAYTGEVSPKTLKELDVKFVIIGHSERRTLFNEDNNLLNEKVQLALKNNLQVVFCVGESLEERESGNTKNILEKQLSTGLKDVKEDIIIAYEPIWAIGTGKTASSEIAQEAHRDIRSICKSLGLQSSEIPIIYGGSVKSSNIQQLISQNDIDGALVGGASLDPESFSNIIKNSAYDLSST